jgi:hypothetical protein
LRIIRALAEAHSCGCERRDADGQFQAHYDTCLYRLKLDADKLRKLVPCEHLSTYQRWRKTRWRWYCSDCGRTIKENP